MECPHCSLHTTDSSHLLLGHGELTFQDAQAFQDSFVVGFFKRGKSSKRIPTPSPAVHARVSEERLKLIAVNSSKPRVDGLLDIQATLMMDFVDVKIPFVIISADGGFDDLVCCISSTSRACIRVSAFHGRGTGDAMYREAMENLYPSRE
jgi:hypothetical protein